MKFFAFLCCLCLYYSFYAFKFIEWSSSPRIIYSLVMAFIVTGVDKHFLNDQNNFVVEKVCDDKVL